MFNEEAEGSIPGIEPHRIDVMRFLLEHLLSRDDALKDD